MRKGTGKRAIVLRGKVAAGGVVCRGCQRLGWLLVLGDDAPSGKRSGKPALGFPLSEAPGVRGAMSRHLRGEE